jgi:hypothetical protein
MPTALVTCAAKQLNKDVNDLDEVWLKIQGKVIDRLNKTAKKNHPEKTKDWLDNDGKMPNGEYPGSLWGAVTTQFIKKTGYKKKGLQESVLSNIENKYITLFGL